MTAETTRRIPGQISDFPGAVIRSNLIYTSGIVDNYALSGQVRSGPDQIRGALDALVGIVERSGGNAAGILRIEAYLASADDLYAWGAAFRKRWPKDPPARTTLIAQLAKPTLAVELQAIAAVDQSRGHDG